MRSTRYFDEQVLRKRPYLNRAMRAAVVATPLRRSVQPDGRVRYRGLVTIADENEPRVLRVVTLDDGVTIHNAFVDRGFREDG